MTFSRKTSFDNIKKALDYISWQVITAGQLNQTDIHIHAENFYRDFLNLLYGWKLKNLNETKQNVAAIDLGDAQSRISVQVTSDNSLTKIRDSVDKFIEKGWNKEFDELIFVRIGKPKKHKKAIIGIQGIFEVSTANCVIEVKDLLTKIQGLTEPRLQEIDEFLSREVKFPENTTPISSNKVIDAAIHKELNNIRKFRFFGGEKTIDKCKRLVERIEEGELSSCSQLVKDKAYCWCARLMASNDLEMAMALMKKVSNIDIAEAKIATAFVLSRSDTVEAALAHLPAEETKEINSARLFLATQEFLSADKYDWVSAYKWIDKTGFSIDDFCPDGKGRCLHVYLHANMWSVAFDCTKSISEADCVACPMLNYLVGTAFLAVTIPEEFRPQILYSPPVFLKNFPISTSAQNLVYLQEAARKFSEACVAARSQNLSVSENISDQFALWITLRNPTTYDQGIEGLKNRLRSSELNLGLVNFAYEFNLPLQADLVEKSINQKETRGVELGFNGAIARITLARLKPPTEAVDYLFCHRESLIRWLPALFVNSVLIDLLCGLGRASEAQKVLRELQALDLPSNSLDRLSNTIQNVDQSQIESLIEEYSTHRNTETLLNLCGLLEQEPDWTRLRQYSEKLFLKVQTVRTLEWLSTSLYNLGEFNEAYEVLSDHQDILEQSEVLTQLWVSAIYSTGNLIEAKRLADKFLQVFPESLFLEELRIQIAITSGNWSWLNQFLLQKWTNRATLSAQQLINLAKVSQSIKFDKTKEFVTAATNSATADAQTFLDAFMLASSAGWEEDAIVGSWLGDALKLSGKEGPVQKFSLEELVNLNPEWNDRKRQTLRQLKEAAIPVFIAAKKLNSGLFSFVVLDALYNHDVSDIRRKSIIRAYSPKRATYDIESDIIGIGATAIISFALLDLLSPLKKVFRTIYIPHSMLGWLFDEKQKLEFNQISQVKRAKNLLELLSNDRLRVLTSSTTDNELSLKIGSGLANLLFFARTEAKEGHRSYVAIPTEVHCVSSLMTELADLSEFKDVTCHCIDLIEYLDLSGLLTTEEKTLSVNFLSSQSESINPLVDLKKGTTVYLSSLTISNLESMKLLEKLTLSELDIVVSDADYERARGTRRHQTFLDTALNILDRIRKFLELEIESGFVKLGPQYRPADLRNDEFMEHPSLSIASLGELTDAVVIDDPFMNQHRQLTTRENNTVPIFTSLDVINHIVKSGAIESTQMNQLKTELRNFGYVALFPNYLEFKEQICKARIRDGKIIQSAELRVLRDSFTHMQIHSALNMPDEYSYLANLFTTCRKIIIDIWNSSDTDSEKEIRSNWLVDLIDLKRWSSCYDYEVGSSVARNSSISFSQLLISRCASITSSVHRLAYLEWLDRRIIQPMRHDDPAAYNQILEKSEADLETIMNMPIEEMQNGEE